MKLHLNQSTAVRTASDATPQRILDEAGALEARREITSWANYQPTPLVELPGLASRSGLGRLWYKDESNRFGLKGFKALGGACAVCRPVRARPGTDRITACCATDGNHGRAVAGLAGCLAAREQLGLGADSRCRIPGSTRSPPHQPGHRGLACPRAEAAVEAGAG